MCRCTLSWRWHISSLPYSQKPYSEGLILRTGARSLLHLNYIFPLIFPSIIIGWTELPNRKYRFDFHFVFSALKSISGDIRHIFRVRKQYSYSVVLLYDLLYSFRKYVICTVNAILYCMNYVEKEPTHYEPALSLVFKIVVPLFWSVCFGQARV